MMRLCRQGHARGTPLGWGTGVVEDTCQLVPPATLGGVISTAAGSGVILLELPGRS